MLYFLAALPILVLLSLMILLHWSGQRAGPAAWAVCVAVAALAYGLTPQVFWVSQLKGLFLSLFVMAVLWPALFLYHVVDQVGGIRAIARWLESAIHERGVLLIVLAWAFSGLLEGLAGFGLPIAVVAPMLVGLGVPPVMAVASTAVGHAWAVTFGDMGVIYQTLVGVVKMDASLLAPMAALMLGVACLACGLATAHILRQGRRWPIVVVLGLLMGFTQYVLAVAGLTPLAAFGAGLTGTLGGIMLGKRTRAAKRSIDLPPHLMTQPPDPQLPALALSSYALIDALISYGVLTALMAAIALLRPLHDALNPLVWQMSFPEVVTRSGFVTLASLGQAFRPLVHPGTSILLVAWLSYGLYRWLGHCKPGSWRTAAASTWKSAAPASVGIIATVGLSALMDHCSMTLRLAQGLSSVMGAFFPIVSPLVGILGAFATGSNNNSNVLFAPLQKSAALLLAIDPRLLISAQTAGGALGSMLAPAKIIVGCSTVGLNGREGEVLRKTLAYGLVIGLCLGGLAWVLVRWGGW